MLMRSGVGVLVLVAVLPVVAGLAGLVGVRPSAFAEVIAAPGVPRALALSVVSGTLATGLAAVLAHLLLATAGSAGWLPRLRAMTLPLLAVPHLALGIGLVLVLAPSGLLLRLLSPWATGFTQPPDWATVQDPWGLSLVLGLLIKETAFLVLALLAALPQVPAEGLLRTALGLGYPPRVAWLATVAPLLARQIRLPLAAVLVYGVTNVDLALALGPRTPPTFAVLLWQWFTSGDLAARELAVAATLLLLAATVAALVVASAVGRVCARLVGAWFARGRRQALAPLGVVLPVAGGLAGVGLVAVLALLLRTVTGPVAFPALLGALSATAVDGPGLVEPARTTLLLALATAVVAVVLVLWAAEALAHRPAARSRVALLLFVPLLLPQLAFLFGWQVLLVRLGLDGLPLAVVWSHLVFALPYAWGVLAEARAGLDPRLPLVARTLGAGPWAAWWRVTVPLLLRATLVAVALVASVSAALYLPTLFAGAGRVATLATEAAAAIAGGNLQEAAAFGALHALLPLAAFMTAFGLGWLLFRHRRGVPG
jgi:putative thiamine transport system permease protein